jgi:hypothetical protein
MLLFVAVLFPWKFFGGIVEEHVLPLVRQRKLKKPEEWVYDNEVTDMPGARM